MMYRPRLFAFTIFDFLKFLDWAFMPKKLYYSWDDFKEDVSPVTNVIPGANEFVIDPIDSILDSGTEFINEATGKNAADKLAEQQRILGEINARFIGEEGAELQRRSKAQFDLDYAQVKGAIGASGIIADTGTSKLFLKEMTKSFQAELAWDKKSVASRQEIAIAGGGIAAQTTEAAGRSARNQTALTLLSLAL